MPEPRPLGESTPIRVSLVVTLVASILGLFAFIRVEVDSMRDDIKGRVDALQADTRSAIKSTDRRLDALITQVHEVRGDVRVNTASLTHVRTGFDDMRTDVRSLESAVQKLSAQVEELQKGK